MPLPTPAPLSIKTSCPAAVRVLTPPGTSPTRYSLSLISFTVPIFIGLVRGGRAQVRVFGSGRGGAGVRARFQAVFWLRRLRLRHLARASERRSLGDHDRAGSDVAEYLARGGDLDFLRPLAVAADRTAHRENLGLDARLNVAAFAHDDASAVDFTFDSSLDE